MRRDEAELANLVAAEPERNRIVALGEEPRGRVQRCPEPRQFVDGRDCGPQRQAGKRLEAGGDRTERTGGLGQNR